jgi:hypothetical protein
LLLNRIDTPLEFEEKDEKKQSNPHIDLILDSISERCEGRCLSLKLMSSVTLEERDVVAIHRLPAEHELSPLIVRLFSSDVKRSVMRVRKELKGRVLKLPPRTL